MGKLVTESKEQYSLVTICSIESPEKNIYLL